MLCDIFFFNSESFPLSFRCYLRDSQLVISPKKTQHKDIIAVSKLMYSVSVHFTAIYLRRCILFSFITNFVNLTSLLYSLSLSHSFFSIYLPLSLIVFKTHLIACSAHPIFLSSFWQYTFMIIMIFHLWLLWWFFFVRDFLELSLFLCCYAVEDNVLKRVWFSFHLLLLLFVGILQNKNGERVLKYVYVW